ncbi:MAG: hypothetical protein U0610_32545 [bacterium]
MQIDDEARLTGARNAAIGISTPGHSECGDVPLAKRHACEASISV